MLLIFPSFCFSQHNTSIIVPQVNICYCSSFAHNYNPAAAVYTELYIKHQLWFFHVRETVYNSIILSFPFIITQFIFKGCKNT